LTGSKPSSPLFSYFPEDILSEKYDSLKTDKIVVREEHDFSPICPLCIAILTGERPVKFTRTIPIHKWRKQTCRNHRGRLGRYAFYLPKLDPSTVFYCVECYSIIQELPEYAGIRALDLFDYIPKTAPAGEFSLNITLPKLKEHLVGQYLRMFENPIRTIELVNHPSVGIELKCGKCNQTRIKCRCEFEDLGANLKIYRPIKYRPIRPKKQRNIAGIRIPTNLPLIARNKKVS